MLPLLSSFFLPFGLLAGLQREDFKTNPPISTEKQEKEEDVLRRRIPLYPHRSGKKKGCGDKKEKKKKS